MLFYHATSATAADAILKEGFRNSCISFAAAEIIPEAVFFSDYPLDTGSGTKGTTTLVVEMPEDEIRENYELVKECWHTYREFIIPADVVNSYGPPRLCSEDEVDQLVKGASLFGRLLQIASIPLR